MHKRMNWHLFNVTVTVLDIGHLPVFLFKTMFCRLDCPRFQVERAHLCAIDRTNLCLR
jgi:hypothetical protein